MAKVFFPTLAAITCFVSAAYAHPPAKIDIVYDAEGKVVAAVITHPVQDPSTHFIEKVDVSINGKEVLTHEISRQDSETMQTVTYRIPDAVPGDRIAVEAYCNVNGKLEKGIEVK